MCPFSFHILFFYLFSNSSCFGLPMLLLILLPRYVYNSPFPDVASLLRQSCLVEHVEFLELYIFFSFIYYVGRNLWICDIHGSACAIHGSIVCAEIHGYLRNLWILLLLILCRAASSAAYSHTGDLEWEVGGKRGITIMK